MWMNGWTDACTHSVSMHVYTFCMNTNTPLSHEMDYV